MTDIATDLCRWPDCLCTAKGQCRTNAEIIRLRAENERLRAALHRISLGSQNSGTTKEDLGREARAALGGTDE